MEIRFIQSMTDEKIFEINHSSFLLRTLFDNTPDPIFWAEIDTGKLIKCNHAAEELLQLPKNEIIKMSYLALHPEEEHPHIQKFFQELMQNGLNNPGSVITTECTAISVKGIRRLIQIRGSLIKIEKMHFAHLIYRDITELRQIEHKLKESEEKFAAAFHSVPIIIAISTQKDGIYLEVNDAFIEILGYRREEVIGKSSKELEIFADYADRERAVELLKTNGYVRNLEVNIKTKKQEIRTVLFSIAKIDLMNMPCLLVSASDISQLRETEQKFSTTYIMLKNLFENANDFIFSFDLNGTILSVNKALQSALEYSMDELLKMDIFQVIAPEYHELTRKMIQKKLKGEVTHTIYELEGITKSGRRILMEINTTIVFTNGKPVAIQGIGRDINERKLFVDERLKTEKLESLSILAGGIAHDFNNILVAILGNVNLMQLEEHNSPSQKQMLFDLEIATKRASDLTKQLMTFAKGGEPLKVTVSIDKVILDSANFILRGSNCKAIFNFKAKNHVVDIDVGQITQAFNNLILNAAQSMPSGGLIKIDTLELDQIEDLTVPIDPKKFILIKIEDQGIGIPEQIRTKIFDPYFTTKKYGTGLGLATVYSIVKRHGGYITFDSVMNKGTIFNIFLPKSNKQIPIEDKINSSMQIFHGSALIMDDDPHVQSVLGKMLAKIGFKVDHASSSEETIQLFRTGTYLIVFMDLTIPGDMGGKDILLKLMEINPKVKAIVSSGYSDDDVMSNYTKYGFIGALKKPYTFEELLQLLQKIL